MISWLVIFQMNKLIWILDQIQQILLLISQKFLQIVKFCKVKIWSQNFGHIQMQFKKQNLYNEKFDLEEKELFQNICMFLDLNFQKKKSLDFFIENNGVQFCMDMIKAKNFMSQQGLKILIVPCCMSQEVCDILIEKKFLRILFPVLQQDIIPISQNEDKRQIKEFGIEILINLLKNSHQNKLKEIYKKMKKVEFLDFLIENFKKTFLRIQKAAQKFQKFLADQAQNFLYEKHLINEGLLYLMHLSFLLLLQVKLTKEQNNISTKVLQNNFDKLSDFVAEKQFDKLKKLINQFYQWIKLMQVSKEKPQKGVNHKNQEIATNQKSCQNKIYTNQHKKFLNSKKFIENPKEDKINKKLYNQLLMTQSRILHSILKRIQTNQKFSKNISKTFLKKSQNIFKVQKTKFQHCLDLCKFSFKEYYFDEESPLIQSCVIKNQSTNIETQYSYKDKSSQNLTELSLDFSDIVLTNSIIKNGVKNICYAEESKSIIYFKGFLTIFLLSIIMILYINIKKGVLKIQLN